MSKLTISEIAQLAGVSIGTVSRALNGRYGVSLETQTAILKIVRDTGFTPNLGAVNLARGSRQLIGIAPFSDHTPSSPYYAYLLDAIQESLYQRGFVARVLEPDLEINRRNCVGFIVPGVHLDEPRVNALRRAGIPVVIVGQVDGDFAWVEVDNSGGFEAIIKHLLKLGHTRIAHVTGTLAAQTAVERYNAYRATLTAAGLEFDASLVLDGGFTDLGAYRAVREFLERHGINGHRVNGYKADAHRLERRTDLPFTALAAASDEMAMGAITALQDLGYRVPHDVSVTGFDDLPFATYINPPLTTVHQPIRSVGRVAAEMLIEQLEGKPVRRVILPVELVIRNSTTPRLT